MIISEKWLREWVNPKLSLQQLADQLTMAGLEIESIHNQTLDVHVTPNRGDCLSVAGVAREIVLLNECALNKPNMPVQAASIQDEFPITVKNPQQCPRYVGRMIRGINTQATSPAWLTERLTIGGIKSIHPVVDITNYVMLELGQPLHAFDLAKLKNGIEVRFAHKEESIALLDDQEVKLDDQTLVIADKNGAQAIAGIMGGKASSVTDTTTDIFLESAFFNPVTISSRSRHYGLITDSAYRFERGVDPNLARAAIERATQLLLEIVGGKAGPASEKVDEKYLPKNQPILLRRERMQRILGIAIPDQTITTILKHLGTQFEADAQGWRVLSPSFRFDLSIEEDLIEEIARVYGYQQIPLKMPENTLVFQTNSERELDVTRIRSLLVDRGYYEAITYSFISPKWHELLASGTAGITLANPISLDLSVMRTSLWAGLLEAALYNQNRQQSRIRFFEIGRRFIEMNKEIKQESMLSGIATGFAYPEQWGMPQRAVDFFDVKNDLEELLGLCGKTDRFSFQKAEHALLHPGQTSQIFIDQKPIGYLGALHPRLLKELDLVVPVYLFELQLDAIQHKELPLFQAISKFPNIRRDISFWVDSKIAIQDIFATIRKHAGELLADLRLFDVYQDNKVKTGRRSLALGLLLQHPERTLLDNEVDEIVLRVIDELKKAFVIELRD